MLDSNRKTSANTSTSTKSLNPLSSQTSGKPPMCHKAPITLAIAAEARTSWTSSGWPVQNDFPMDERSMCPACFKAANGGDRIPSAKLWLQECSKLYSHARCRPFIYRDMRTSLPTLRCDAFNCTAPSWMADAICHAGILHLT